MGMGGKRREFYRDELWQVLDNDGNKREIWTLHFKKPFPLSILCEPCLIHRSVFLSLSPSSLNCCSPNPLFFLLIPPVFSLSPSSAPYVPVCLLSCVLMSSSWNLFSPLLVSSVLTLSAPSLISFILPSLALRSSAMRHPHMVFFLRRQRLVTDAVTKLPIKSMFNSDDCGPLTEKVEAFHL